MAGSRIGVKQVQFGPELEDAAELAAASRNWSFSTLVRVALAEYIKRPELGRLIKYGPGPRKAAKKRAAKPAKKNQESKSWG